MVQFKFRGLMAPVFTPFNKDFSINLEIIPKYAQHLAKSGINAILVNGTSGEGPSLNLCERKLVTEAWLKAAKSTNQHVMVQIGGCPLPDVLVLAQHAQKIGVDSLLCLPELYFKPTNSDELINYLKRVGEAAPKIPLLYYHIPMFSKVDVHMGQFIRDVEGKIPNFKGIKFTSTNLDEGMAAVKANSDYAIFLGADQLIAGALALGFDSVIATSLNIVPQLSIDIVNAVEQSDIKKAREIQENLTNFCTKVTKNGGWVSTMKSAMNLIVTDLDMGAVRAPLKQLTDEQIIEMKDDLKT